MPPTIPCLVLSVFCFGCASQPVDQKKEIEKVQSDVRRIVHAGYEGDIETILELTHAKVIEGLGGQAKARETLTGVMQKLATVGLKLEELTFPEDPIFLRGTQHDFVIVPTKSIILSRGKRGESLNYQFGARRVSQSAWTYLEGSRINRETVGTFFPDFPNDYQFPAIYRKLIE